MVTAKTSQEVEIVGIAPLYHSITKNLENWWMAQGAFSSLWLLLLKIRIKIMDIQIHMAWKGCSLNVDTLRMKWNTSSCQTFLRLECVVVHACPQEVGGKEALRPLNDLENKHGGAVTNMFSIILRTKATQICSCSLYSQPWAPCQCSAWVKHIFPAIFFAIDCFL